MTLICECRRFCSTNQAFQDGLLFLYSQACPWNQGSPACHPFQVLRILRLVHVSLVYHEYQVILNSLSILGHLKWHKLHLSFRE